MASLAEGSVGSVAMPDIAALRDNILQHGTSSLDAQAARRPPQANDQQPRCDQSRSVPGDQHEIPESVHLDGQPESLTRSQPPRLTPSKSAPADIDAMAHEDDVQGAVPTIARATSFHGYTGGDTQPLDSQVYRDFTESMSKSANTTPKKVVYNFTVTPQDGTNTYDTAITDKTPRTVTEGDTEFVDFGEAWKPDASPSARSNTSNIEDFLVTQQVESQPSNARNGNAFPQTPALAGNKRRRSGELLTSAAPDTTTKTPGYSQFDFAPRPGLLSNTQLFNQTQAPSSPAAEVLRSDPVLTRPSPLAQHYSTFPSPSMISSSPMLSKHVPAASMAGEPRTTFTRMDESQERRAPQLRQDLELQKRFGPDAIAGIEDEEDDDSQQRRYDNKRMQRILSDQAISEMSKMRAPTRPGSRPHSSGGKRPVVLDLTTPGTVHRATRVDFDLSSDDETTPDAEDVEEPALPENAGVADDDGDIHHEDTDDGEQQDDDVYDELSQAVIRSQPAMEGDDHDDTASADENGDEEGEEDKDLPLDAHINDLMVGAAAVDEGSPPVVLIESSNDDNAEKIATQPAVADSQPEATKGPSSRETRPGPTSSFVPGSQYAGGADQGTVGNGSQIPDSSKHPTAAPGEPSAEHENNTRMPSSPPVREDDATIPKNSLEASALRRDMIAQFQHHAETGAGTDGQSREIPDSDIRDAQTEEPARESSEYQTATEAHSVPVFSTARTHTSDAVATPEKPRLVKELSKASASQNSVPSPLKAAGVRRFADITADTLLAEETEATQNSVDVDAIMGNVMTMEDQNFLNVLSSPPSEKPTKRRRLMQDRSSSRSSKDRGTPMLESRPAGATASPLNGGIRAELTDDVPMLDTEPAVAPLPAVRTLQNSPSKANEAPVPCPEDPKAPDTPGSVRVREAAGAKAASQLLSGRTTRTATTPKLSSTGRKTTSSRDRDVQPSRPKRSKLRHSKEQIIAGTSDVSDNDYQAQDEDMHGIGEQDEVLKDINAATSSAFGLAVSAPERIFAHFRGAGYNAYYPATWLSSSTNGATHKVRFDDTTVTSLESKDVFALDLRIGDVVKVDYDGYRGKNWLITGYGRMPESEEDRALGVDVHDNVTLKVRAKAPQRNSLSAAASVPQGEGDELEIQVTYVKITHTMLPHFADRVFVPPGNPAQVVATPVSTPAQGVHTPDAETPASRVRRSTIPSAQESVRQPSKLREASVASSHTPSGVADVFDNMAFAISYASNESEKAEVTRLIQRHGGRILEIGFDELFITPQLEEPTSPSKRGPKTSRGSAETGSLELKPEFHNLGFIALVADKHSRRAKYMQALALGLPTLSGRWILDSLDSIRNPSVASNSTIPPQPRPWSRYLLPAGDSAYLGGAVHSRTLALYQASTAKLADTVANRPQLLNNAGVLLVAPKKGKTSWDRRKAYAFLTLALGAGSVRRVADLAEAKSLLSKESDKWTWVYVDEDVSGAAKVLFGAKATSKKRRRGEVTGKDGKELVVAGGEGRVRVVGDEFVVQSLILGELID